MSAIFGILHLDEQPVSQENLEKMDSALESFGPDDYGFWVSENVGLGQREMHFTPEDRFNQLPLKSADGKRVLVCDARLDNRPELTIILDIRPAEANAMADSAFITLAYEKWGMDCVNHLIGDFSFALWDEVEQRLLLVCSPITGRPLFYRATSQMFAFATMPQGLFSLQEILRELDLEYLARYLTQRGNAPDQTFFRGINKLPPGHLLTACREGVKVRQYWKPELQREIRYPHDNDYVEAFNELFERAVSDRLRSISPVGVMMSGGLDSTSVAATAASIYRRNGRRLATFTEVPRSGFNGLIVDGKYADETGFVQTMAKQYENIDLNLIRTDGQMYLAGLEEFFQVSYAPFRNASNRVWYEAIMQHARKQGVRVLLTGAQGNLTISRNGDRLLPQLIRSGKLVRALREARALRRNNYTRSTLRTCIGQGVMPLLPAHLQESIRKFRGNGPLCSGKPAWYAHAALNADFAQQYVKEKSANGWSVPVSNYDIRKRITKLLPVMAAGAAHIDHVYRAKFGVEVRDPTADVRIVEFCLALPEEQYLKDGLPRRLIRRAMQNKLPAEILDNRQRGLQAADWFERLNGSRGKILAVIQDWSNSSILPFILDLKRLNDMVESMPNANNSASEQMKNYRFVLEFGLMTGSFIRWFEAGAHQRV